MIALRLIALAAAGVVALTAAGCAQAPALPAISGPSAADALADVAVVEAASDAERKLRAAALLAIIAELAADRIMAEDLAAAPEAAARLAGFAAMAARLRAQQTMWLETELYEIRTAIYFAVGGAAALQVRLYLARAGLSLATARTALRYAGKGGAMLADLDRAFTAMAAGEVDESALWDGLIARIEQNRKRVAAAAQLG
jgi:hypothetical protein